MKKAILLSSLLMLCAALALAQDTQSSSPSDNASASAGSNTVQGCLSGSSGNYMLTDSTGVMYQLQGDESKLSANVNKEVEITGTTGAEASASAANSPDSNAAGNTSSGAAGGASAGANANAAKTLNVTSIKKVADSCSSGK